MSALRAYRAAYETAFPKDAPGFMPGAEARLRELLPAALDAWRAAEGYQREFVAVASNLAAVEGPEAPVCALLVRELDRAPTEREKQFVATEFLRAAINSNGPFDTYRWAARASPFLREVPNVRRYLL